MPCFLIIQKKKIYIQITKLFSFCKIDLCCFRLLFQRFQLPGQLGQNICHTYKILAFFLQLLDRSIFSPFKLYNSRSLVKKLPSFLRLSTQDFINLPLTDNRVTLLTDTSIIEHFLNIFQTTVASIDQIFTFSGTVQPSGNRNFIKIHRKLMVAVIQGNGN